MAFDAIEICMGELNMRLEDHIMKAVQNVDVNVNREKLLKAIRATDFVDELIEYLKDDDYITPEEICCKLLKHGLINKYDGQYTTQECRPTHSTGDLVYLEDVFDAIDNNGWAFDEPQWQAEFRLVVADLPRVKGNKDEQQN